jgi:uncharacterized protein DUF3108
VTLRGPAVRRSALTALCLLLEWKRLAAQPLPFGPGERIVLRITYARLLAGRAVVAVEADPERATFRLVATAKSQGFFAWLFRFEVEDRTVAEWDPQSSCSLGIEKRLREGRARRDQKVVIDPVTGRAEVDDKKVAEREFALAPCTLDVLSALFVARRCSVREGEPPLRIKVFDNGKSYVLETRFLARETLDLPKPLGKSVKTIVVEPVLAEGTGLFVKEGRLKLWLTDDDRRIPVRMRSKVAIGSVSADLESYEPGPSQ